ncbi:hypothetical protein D3248_05030 [Leucobacter zeae]|nr:hypothetical protein [Leucobacter zeae]
MSYAETSASARRYLPPAVAVSTVAFALGVPDGAVTGSDAGAAPPGTTFWIPLVRRTRAPFLGRWALPGGPTEWDETLADTALRTLRSAALRDPGYVEQLYSFGGVQRSAEAQRLVTIAYWALYGEHDLATPAPAASDTAAPAATRARPRQETAVRAPRWDDPVAPRLRSDAGDPGGLDADRDRLEDLDGAAAGANVAWFPVDALPELAFDHDEIIAYALDRLRSKTEYASVAHRFLGETFTLGQLRAVHEAVRGGAVDPANFRRQALAQGNLVDTGAFETGTRHRPAKLYRFRGADDETTGTGMPR